MKFKPLRKILHKILHKKGKSVNFECFVREIRAKSKLREKLKPFKFCHKSKPFSQKSYKMPLQKK